MAIIDSFGTGGTYLTVQAAYQYLLSIDPLTDNYEFMQVGDCTETGWPGLPDLNLNGHYVEFYCPFTNSHQGDPTKGYKIYVTNSMVIQLRAMAGGLVDNIILDGLYFHRTDGIDTNILYIGSWNAGAAMTYTLKNLIIRGTANNKARGIRIVNSTLQAYYLNNIKFKLLGQGINFQISGGVGADHIVENISVDECGEGIGWSANGQAWDIRNSVCVNCNNGWGLLGGGGNNNLYNCADDDNSMAASGANLIDCQPNIIPANEFASLNIADSDWLDLKQGTIDVSFVRDPAGNLKVRENCEFTPTVGLTPGSQNLGINGTAPVIAGHNTDIKGKPIPGGDNLYSIGAMEQQYS